MGFYQSIAVVHGVQESPEIAAARRYGAPDHYAHPDMDRASADEDRVADALLNEFIWDGEGGPTVLGVHLLSAPDEREGFAGEIPPSSPERLARWRAFATANGIDPEQGRTLLVITWS